MANIQMYWIENYPENGWTINDTYVHPPNAYVDLYYWIKCAASEVLPQEAKKILNIIDKSKDLRHNGYLDQVILYAANKLIRKLNGITEK